MVSDLEVILPFSKPHLFVPKGSTVSQLDMAKNTWWPTGGVKPIVWDETKYEGNITYNWGSLSAEVQSERFWTAATNGAHCAGHSNTALLPQNLPNCSNPNNDGTHHKPLCNPIMWWNKGGQLRGHSPPRVQFYRDQMEGGDVPAYDTMRSDKLWEDATHDRGAGVYRLFSQNGAFHLVYWLNTTQTVTFSLGELTAADSAAASAVSAASSFTASHLDYWNMTATAMPDVVGPSATFTPPVENFVLKLVRKAH